MKRKLAIRMLYWHQGKERWQQWHIFREWYEISPYPLTKPKWYDFVYKI